MEPTQTIHSGIDDYVFQEILKQLKSRFENLFPHISTDTVGSVIVAEMPVHGLLGRHMHPVGL
jgi:hypothetical protein